MYIRNCVSQLVVNPNPVLLQGENKFMNFQLNLILRQRVVHPYVHMKLCQSVANPNPILLHLLRVLYCICLLVLIGKT